MGETDREKVENELPSRDASPRLGIRRSGEYLTKVEASGGAIYLLSRHAEYEMSRLELLTRVRFAIRPRFTAHQSLYLLTGELVCLARGVRLGPGSSFKIEGDIKPLLFEALCPTTLLYFSTASDFCSLGEDLERAL